VRWWPVALATIRTNLRKPWFWILVALWFWSTSRRAFLYFTKRHREIGAFGGQATAWTWPGEQ
jgi:hypothetical protein